MSSVPNKPHRTTPRPPPHPPSGSLDENGNTEWDNTARSTYERIKQRQKERREEEVAKAAEISSLKRQIRIKLFYRTCFAVGFILGLVIAAIHTARELNQAGISSGGSTGGLNDNVQMEKEVIKIDAATKTYVLRRKISA